MIKTKLSKRTKTKVWGNGGAWEKLKS